MSEEPRIKAGVGVMIIRDGKVLLGKRRGSHGAGEYAFPGGHLEFGESIIDAAKREAMEEAGVKIKNIKFLCFTNLTKYEGKHYMDFGVSAELENDEPKVMEPDFMESWDWYDIDNLPEPLFGATTNRIEAYKTGKNFFDSSK
jgi:8-oxo-dGTP diphosphatase